MSDKYNPRTAVLRQLELVVHNSLDFIGPMC